MSVTPLKVRTALRFVSTLMEVTCVTAVTDTDWTRTWSHAIVCYNCILCKAASILASLDINECSEGTSSCSQICQDTDGSYSCSCYVGYLLDPDGTTCIIEGTFIMYVLV